MSDIDTQAHIAKMVVADTLDEFIDQLHAHWRQYDLAVWKVFHEGGPVPGGVIAEVPDNVVHVVRSHPRYEDYQLGDDCARLDVETGGYEAVRKLTASDIVIDVGAHIGHFARRALDVGADVLAFEPEPRNVRMLARLWQTTPFAGRLTVYPVAVGASRGQVTLNRGLISSQHRIVPWPAHLTEGRMLCPSVQVTQVALDDLGDLHPTFVKIDAEGSEADVLVGMQRTVDVFRPFIVVEVAEQLDRCAEFLQQHDYTVTASTHMHKPPAPMDLNQPFEGLWHAVPF